MVKRTIGFNKSLSKAELLAENPNLNHLFEPSFQGLNKVFVLAAFKNDHKEQEIKDVIFQMIHKEQEIKDVIFQM